MIPRAFGRLLLASLMLTGAACTSLGPSGVPELAGPGSTSVVGESDLGIRIVALRPTAGGNLVDLRFRVIDPIKAAPLFDPKAPPSLVVEESGRSMTVPYMGQVGSLRTTSRGAPVTADRVYTMLFANSAASYRMGSEMSLVVGGRSLRHLTVADATMDEPPGERHWPRPRRQPIAQQ